MDMFLSSMGCSAVPIRISMLPSPSLLNTSQCRSQVRQRKEHAVSQKTIFLMFLCVEVRVGGVHCPPGVLIGRLHPDKAGRSKWNTSIIVLRWSKGPTKEHVRERPNHLQDVHGIADSGSQVQCSGHRTSANSQRSPLR